MRMAWYPKGGCSKDDCIPADSFAINEQGERVAARRVRPSGTRSRPYLWRFIDVAQSSLRTKLGPKPKYGLRP
jgi:hypothetical protein